MLSDRTIREELDKYEGLSISPLDYKNIQPCSVDLRLGDVAVPDDRVTWHQGQKQGRVLIRPGEFLLASTKECVRMPRYMVGTLHGKSTRARQGLQVHAAGLVDPGFEGELTLELSNLSAAPIDLLSGMLICQITFEYLTCVPDQIYGSPGVNSHYQGQRGPTPAAEVF